LLRTMPRPTLSADEPPMSTEDLRICPYCSPPSATEDWPRSSGGSVAVPSLCRRMGTRQDRQPARPPRRNDCCADLVGRPSLERRNTPRAPATESISTARAVTMASFPVSCPGAGPRWSRCRPRPTPYRPVQERRGLGDREPPRRQHERHRASRARLRLAGTSKHSGLYVWTTGNEVGCESLAVHSAHPLDIERGKSDMRGDNTRVVVT